MNYTYEELQELLRTKQVKLDAALERERTLAKKIKHSRKLLSVWADTVDSLNEQTSGEIECDAMADAMRSHAKTMLNITDTVPWNQG